MRSAEEIRKLYLEFFKSKGHSIIPSASLMPENDPTVLFTTAGMHPLVPYLLGENHPEGKRLTSCQKCIRTGDIDEVGDDVHLTFFEMLGNWSFGDYWKKEAIELSFEFLTKKLDLQIEKLAVSCFAGDKDAPKDEESAGIWKSLGIPENRIYFFDKKDNWWGPAGITGPCGPDTEMFYWTGSGEPPDLITGDKKEGWVEIWNDVFMQYNKTSEEKYEQLKQKNVDTGMGLERTVSVLNNSDLYQIDLFKPIIEKIENLSGKEYESDEKTKKSMRIIADHIRSSVFIIGDERGISPSNSGQGYVLRRLIRRAIRHGKLLEINEFFTKKISESVIEISGKEYSEIKKNEKRIFEELQKEEEKFTLTLENGIKEFSKLEKIDGKSAFNLYQSYGFPLELTEELSREGGFEIKKSDFEKEFEKHQELSRTSSSGMFKGGLSDNSEKVTELHTTTHLLHKALREVLGEHVSQKGSNITNERLRFDFSHGQKMTKEEIEKVEDIVNEKIKESIPVNKKIMKKEEAEKTGAMRFFGEKYGDQVSVYYIGESLENAYSKEFCGGPHVKNTSEIKGVFKIIKEEAVASGIRRIKANII